MCVRISLVANGFVALFLLMVLLTASFSSLAETINCDCTERLRDVTPEMIEFLDREIGLERFSTLLIEDGSLGEVGLTSTDCPNKRTIYTKPRICKPGSIDSSPTGGFRGSMRPLTNGIYLYTATPATISNLRHLRPTIHIARILDDQYQRSQVKSAIEEQLGLELVEGASNDELVPSLEYDFFGLSDLVLSATDPEDFDPTEFRSKMKAVEEKRAEEQKCRNIARYQPSGMQFNNRHFMLSISINNTANKVSMIDDDRPSYIVYKITFVDSEVEECKENLQEFYRTYEKGKNLRLD